MAQEGEEVEVEKKDDKSPHAPFKGQNALALWQPLVLVFRKALARLERFQ
jgi:hypothetical protein